MQPTAAIALPLLLACASSPGPDPSARPPGENWYCTRPFCERTAEDCEQARLEVSARREELRKIWHDSLDASADCMPTPSAICYTYRDARNGPALFQCFREQDDCERMREHDAPLQGHMDVSTCGTWY